MPSCKDHGKARTQPRVTSRPRNACTLLVLSRQSKQLVRTVPLWPLQQVRPVRQLFRHEHNAGDTRGKTKEIESWHPPSAPPILLWQFSNTQEKMKEFHSECPHTHQPQQLLTFCNVFLITYLCTHAHFLKLGQQVGAKHTFRLKTPQFFAHKRYQMFKEWILKP